MKGAINRIGDVTISFNTQDEKLMAPDFAGIKMQWLPCEVCGSVWPVEWEVVSYLCKPCYDHKETCDLYECAHPIHDAASNRGSRPVESFVHDPVE